MTTATSSDLVISPGLYDATTEYIEVLPIVTADGTNNLSLANSILTNVVTESNAVPANVKVGQNFFYGIEQYNSSVGNLRQLLLSESGIGELIESDGGIFLKREHVFEQSLEDEFYTPITSESFLKFDEDSYVIITTYIPTDYIQLCAQKDAVLNLASQIDSYEKLLNLQKDQDLIKTLMGNDVSSRKDFIVDNAINVLNLDI